MNFLSASELPDWTMLLRLAAYFAVGIMVGVIYFRTLWWQSRRFAAGGSFVKIGMTMLARFVLLGGLLTLASFEGAMPLMLMALGVLIARAGVMRSVREATQ